MRIKSASLKVWNWSQDHCLKLGSGQNSRDETEKSSLCKTVHQKRQDPSQPLAGCVLSPLWRSGISHYLEEPDGGNHKTARQDWVKVRWVITLTQVKLSNQNSKKHEENWYHNYQPNQLLIHPRQNENIRTTWNDLKINMFRILKEIKKGKTAIKQTLKVQSQYQAG